MKIRIKSNSLRLRLSQSEIDAVKNSGLASDSINFGPRKLIYMLQVIDQPTVTASFEGEYIIVNVPSGMAESWVSTDQVGIEAEQPLEGAEKLTILLEKDFQCLKARPGEDQDDLFENPLAKL